MNDCFLYWVEICSKNCSKCYSCSLYISINSEEGDKLNLEYSIDVEEALKPVREKWRNKLMLK